jgi:predicted enzyme related to lactoylglutathione lyase
MTNPQGTPIWYELLTDDPARIAPFYQAVMKWAIAPHADPAAGGMDYRMIERAGGGFAGGVLTLTDQMKGGGARPAWLTYFGVGDVDAKVAQARQLGASVRMPATTLEGVGRMAMLADPQGAPFYLMRGDSDEDSTAYSGMTSGGCAWNELSTADPPAAVEFYRDLLGFGTDNFMPMGDAGRYTFIEVGGPNSSGGAIGAIGPCMQREMPSAWMPYFRTAGTIGEAKLTIELNGGMITMGPMEVPGGDWIVVAVDPSGAAVGFVGTKD